MSQFKKILHSPFTGYTTLVRWYGTTPVIAGILVIVICTSIIIFKFSQTIPATDSSAGTLAIPLVKVTTAEAYRSSFSGSLIGTAVAKTEATLLTERGGQVTLVPVTLGQRVLAGTIIAQFENSAERAVLTQARGAYESALATAEQGTLSISDAESKVADIQRAIVNAHNNAQATVTNIVASSIDVFFANQNTVIPSLRVNGRGKTEQLISLRKTLQTQLPEWQKNTTTLTPDSNPTSELTLARNTIKNVITMADIFIANFQLEKGDSQYSIEDYRAFVTNFTQIRTTLGGLLNNFSNLESDLVMAKENVTRATLGGGSESSLASAQITQARGTLQAAEANFNKTIIRSPITGTIATLGVKAGDYTNPQALVAKITTTDGIEITTFITESEKDYFSIGDSVRVNESATGTITAIAPTINTATQKIEVRIAVSDSTILPGSTVSISLPNTALSTPTTAGPVSIPITAVKFNHTDSTVFMVENNKLLARPVTLGPITGTMVTILEGIDQTTPFVLDARGKTAGEEVEVVTQ